MTIYLTKTFDCNENPRAYLGNDPKQKSFAIRELAKGERLSRWQRLFWVAVEATVTVDGSSRIGRKIYRPKEQVVLIHRRSFRKRTGKSVEDLLPKKAPKKSAFPNYGSCKSIELARFIPKEA